MKLRKSGLTRRGFSAITAAGTLIPLLGGGQRKRVGEALRHMPSRKPIPVEQEAKNSAVFVLNYKDGLRAAGFLLTRSGNDRTFAARRKGSGEVYSTYFGTSRPSRPLPHFDGLVKCIDFQRG